MIKVVNKGTGEIMAWDPSNLSDIVQALLEIKQLEDSLQRAKDKLKELADVELGESDSFGDAETGYAIKRQVRNPKEYAPRSIWHILGEDMFFDFAKIDKKLLDTWRKEAVERQELAPEMSEALDGALEFTGKVSSFLKLERIA